MKLKNIFSVGLLACLLVPLPLSAQDSTSGGWSEAAIMAINFAERKLMIDKEPLRVALRARITDSNGQDLKFEALQPQYIIRYQQEGEKGEGGDILDIVLLAMP